MINEDDLKQEELKLRQKQLEMDRIKYDKLVADELQEKERIKTANEKIVKEMDSSMRWIKFGGISILVFIIFVVVKCNSASDEYKPDPVIESKVYTETYIENLLKSPSTAEFGYAEVIEISPNVYHVSNYVDSQNSFGATVRMKYECDITWKGDSYNITNVVTD